MTVLVYEPTQPRLIARITFTKAAPTDTPPRDLDDGIAAYLSS